MASNDGPSKREWGRYPPQPTTSSASSVTNTSQTTLQNRQSTPQGPPTRVAAVQKSSSTIISETFSACSAGRMAPFMMRPQVQEHLPDGSVKFKLSRYPGEMLDALNTLRGEGSLCDVKLRVALDCSEPLAGCPASSRCSNRGDIVQAHKVILAASSLYFRGMFARGMREASLSEVCIRENNVTASSLRTLVDFAYTGELLVTQNNAQDLLMAAIFLEIHHAIEACTLYLEQQLDPLNCVGMMEFARAHGCIDLEDKARQYCYEHFCDVAKHDEILELPVEDMAHLVQQEHLNVNCESEVFSAVVRWVEHSPEQRVEQLESLLTRGVRLSSLAPAYLEEQLERCHLLRRQPRCYKLLLDKLRRLTRRIPSLNKQSSKFGCSGGTSFMDIVGNEGASSSVRVQNMEEEQLTVEPPPRKPGGQRVIYIAGGFYRKVLNALKCFECFDPMTREWTRLPDMPRSRCGAGVIGMHGRVYVIGGRVMGCGDGDADTCSVDVYDPRENKWSMCYHMDRPRSRVGVAVLDERIYAVGGSAGKEYHNTVERYNPTTDRWEMVTNMHVPRVSPGVAVVNRLIYVMGGFDGARRMSCMECYHPDSDTWEVLSPMQQPRSGSGVTVLRNQIYVMGGFDGTNQLNSVERYNPASGTWQQVAPMLKPRSGVGVGVIDDKIYALGGYDGSDFLSCVESYDPDTDTWKPETLMLCERSGHGVTVERRPTLS